MAPLPRPATLGLLLRGPARLALAAVAARARVARQDDALLLEEDGDRLAALRPVAEPVADAVEVDLHARVELLDERVVVPEVLDRAAVPTRARIECAEA